MDMSLQQSRQESPSADVAPRSPNASCMIQSVTRPGTWMAPCHGAGHHEQAMAAISGPVMAAPLVGAPRGPHVQAMYTFPGSMPAERQPVLAYPSLNPDCRWVMPQPVGLQPATCQPGQVLYHSHPGSLGYTCPVEHLGRVPQSVRYNGMDPNQAIQAVGEGPGLMPENIGVGIRGDRQPEIGSGRNFAEILNKVMMSSSGRLMALLQQELDRQDSADEERCELQDTRPTGSKPENTERPVTKNSEPGDCKGFQKLDTTESRPQASDELEGPDQGSASGKLDARSAGCRL